jgi:hypothetical protein
MQTAYNFIENYIRNQNQTIEIVRFSDTWSNGGTLEYSANQFVTYLFAMCNHGTHFTERFTFMEVIFANGMSSGVIRVNKELPFTFLVEFYFTIYDEQPEECKTTLYDIQNLVLNDTPMNPHNEHNSESESESEDPSEDSSEDPSEDSSEDSSEVEDEEDQEAAPNSNIHVLPLKENDLICIIDYEESDQEDDDDDEDYNAPLLRRKRRNN